LVQAMTVGVLIWVNVSMTAQHIRSSCAGLTRVSIGFRTNFYERDGLQ